MTNSPVDTNRFLRFRSALGDDLICNRFAGNEKLGCLFDYQLGLLSGDPDIDFNRIVGTQSHAPILGASRDRRPD